MGKRTRPEPILRFFVEGKAVSGPEFWEAVKRLGGRAVVETVELPPSPDEPAARPTKLGRLAAERGWR